MNSSTDGDSFALPDAGSFTTVEFAVNSVSNESALVKLWIPVSEEPCRHWELNAAVGFSAVAFSAAGAFVVSHSGSSVQSVSSVHLVARSICCMQYMQRVQYVQCSQCTRSVRAVQSVHLVQSVHSFSICSVISANHSVHHKHTQISALAYPVPIEL